MSRATRSLFVGDDCPATAEPTTSTRRLQARLRALTDQLALELGDRAEDVEHQAPGGGRGVDPLREAAKTELPALELADQLDQMPQRAAEAIQAPHHQRVLAVAQLLERPLELRPLRKRSRRGVAEPARAAGRFERVELQREVLVAGRDAGVADQHARIVSKPADETKSETLIADTGFGHAKPLHRVAVWHRLIDGPSRSQGAVIRPTF